MVSISLDELCSYETSKIDFKEKVEIHKSKSWLKSVSAFANTHGGQLIFGVADNPRTVVGLEDIQKNISELTERIKTYITPNPVYTIEPIQIEGLTCIILTIQDGPNYPYYYKTEGSIQAYVRHGDQSIKVSTSELNDLILKGKSKTFDSLPTNYRPGDVSFTLLTATFKNVLQEEFISPRELISIGLQTESGQITNGGLLLCDQGILSQSRIFCTRWKGLTKGAVENDALDDKEYKECSIITLLQNAEDFIKNNSKNPWSIKGTTREELSDYPYRAVREILVNAIIHRDYQITGSEIHIDMFDDRLEVSSPGGMLNGKRIQDMNLHRIPSLRRNEIISDVFSRLGYMERRGSGIDRIYNSYGTNKEKPEFYSDSDYFLVILPNRSYFANNFVGYFPDEISVTSQPLDLNSQNLDVVSQNLDFRDNYLEMSSQKLDFDPETELLNFEKLIKKENSKWIERTVNNTISLFKKYGFEYTFTTQNIESIFHVKYAAANLIISKLLKSGYIVKVKKGTYQFDKSTIYNLLAAL